MLTSSTFPKQRDAGQPDQTKARALEALEPISNKLLGLQVTSDPESVGPKEVTVEEQVERLIREARDSKNLGSMSVAPLASLRDFADLLFLQVCWMVQLGALLSASCFLRISVSKQR